MAKLKALVEPLVYDALINEPKTRGDDFLLIYEVMKHFVNEQMSLESVLKHHKELGIPSLESITRCRRKLQEKHDVLRNRTAKEIRDQEEKQYREYATDN